MNPSARVLIVEDDAALASALGVAVRKAGGIPVPVHSAGRANAALDAGGIGLVILDIGLPDRNGLDLLRERAAQGHPLPPLFVLTAHGAIENAIEARRLGVIDFFEKPVDLASLQSLLTCALQSLQEPAPSSPPSAAPLTYIGAAESMRSVFQAIAQACVSLTPVLIEGETGTGKTATANLIFHHDPQQRSYLKLAATDTAGVHDAFCRRPTQSLLLEEISGLSEDLQELMANRIEAESQPPIRLVATSTVPLGLLVRDGSFSAALYYRLQPARISLPPLRERLSDLPALAAWFLGEIRPAVAFRLKPAALLALERHSWPGNVRELRNALSWACLAAGARLAIDVQDLPPEVHGQSSPDSGAISAPLADSIRRWLDDRLRESPDLPYRGLIDELEETLLRDLLRRHQHKPSRLAAERAMNRSTLRKRLQDLGIDLS